MFGLFERGSRSFSTILLVAALALVFFSQKGGYGPMRSTESGAGKKPDEDTGDSSEATIFYSRTLGKAENIPEKRVLKEVAPEKSEKPETKAQVLFSRKLGQSVKEEKPFNVLYSRSLGIPENKK